MSTQPKSDSGRKPMLLFGGVAGVVTGGILSFLALLLGGFGHGWGSPLVPSMFALVGYPLLGIAVAMPPSQSRLALSVLLIFAAITGDLALISATREEGSQYFHRAFDSL